MTFWDNKKILVTGGAGYIGSITCKILNEQGFTPVIFDNFSNSKRVSVSNFEIHEGDLRDIDDISKVVEQVKPDGVIHFAALKAAGESMDIPEAYYENNVGGSANLFKALIDHGVHNVVFSSTAAVYGEPDKKQVSETDPIRPENAYGHTKYMVEEMLMWLAKLNRLNSIRLRYFNVAGALEDGSMGEDDGPKLANIIPLLMKRALNQRDFQLFGNDYPTHDGTCIRDYIHVVDLAHAHVLALKKLEEFEGSDVYNVGVGKGSSNLELITIAQEISGNAFEYEVVERRVGDPAEYYANSDKIQKELGWKAKYTSRDAVEHAWKWHSSHPFGYEG